MARPSVKKRLVDLDNPETKRRVLRWFGTLGGMYRVTAVPAAPTRSNRQLGWYFAEIAGALAEYLTEQEIRKVTAEEAHEILKREVLGVPIFHPTLGRQVAVFVPHSPGTTEQFADYCDRARAWLADTFGIVTNDPEPDPAKRERTKRAARATAARG